MKLLRVTPSYASREKPGSGLNAYYHSKFGSNETLVLTESKELNYLESSTNVILKPIKVNMSSLAKPNAPIFFQILKGFLKIFRSFEFLFKSIKHLHRFRPTIVHLYTPIHLATGIYCKLVFNSILVISLHGTDSFRIKKAPILRRLLLFSDRVLLMSENMRKDINISSRLVTFLGNGYDNDIFYNDEKSSRKKQIIAVGNLRWQKDHHTLIKAFSKFKKKYPDYRLIIVGDGDLKLDLEKLIKSLGLESFVKLAGALPSKSVANIMRQSDFFCLSSVSEGFPKVILEALACGLPVLSTDVGDISDVVKDAGIIVKPSSVECLYEGMLLMKEKNQLVRSREFHGLIGLRSWKNISIKLDNIYKSLLLKKKNE